MNIKYVLRPMITLTVHFRKTSANFFIALFFCSLLSVSTKADDISYTNIQTANDGIQVTWDVFGQRWHAFVTQDEYLGNEISIIEVSVSTGNEQLKKILPNCYYRGTLTDDYFIPLKETYAFINLCHESVPFTGFVSDSNGVYVIETSNIISTGLQMTIDNPNLPTPYQGIDPNHGAVNDMIPQGLYPRTGGADRFPSVEFLVEPSYVSKYENDAFIHRIIENLAFANFIYQLNNMKQLHLIAITLVDQSLIWSGGSGSIRNNLQSLRMRTAQPSSADMSFLYLGSSVNTNNLWGWAEEGYACDLQRAVAEDRNVNTINIGRSSGYNVDLPSLIQRGWIVAHELGHLLNGKHVQDDPLMEGHFVYAPALSDYIAGCKAKLNLLESCAYNKKNWKFTDFYSCLN